MTQLALGLFRVHRIVVTEKQSATFFDEALVLRGVPWTETGRGYWWGPTGHNLRREILSKGPDPTHASKTGLEGNAIFRPHDIRMVLALRHVPRSTVALDIIVPANQHIPTGLQYWAQSM